MGNLLIPGRGGGGEGKNYANYLKMEHCIQDNKQLMRAMRGNKTLKAVQRSSSSSYGQEFGNHFNRESDIPLATPMPALQKM